MPDTNYQPTLVLNQSIQFYGTYPTRDGGSPNASIGYIRTYAAARELSEVEAEGALIPISQNTALFSILGTYYGGNGTTTFGAPNLSGRISLGVNDNYSLGSQNGSATINLGGANLPASAGGGSNPFDNLQPSVAVNWIINVEGLFPGYDSYISPEAIGVVSQFAGNFEPNGAMFADGRLLAISEYSALFAILGTTYGGDGVNTFALPDLRGRTPIGAGNGFTVGETVGSATTTVGNTNLPTQLNGGGQPVSNYGPSLVMHALITTQGIYPAQERDFDGFDPTMSEVFFFAGTYNVFRGALPTNGQLLSIAQNSALFSLLGTTYGGDGITTFALPDLRGRAIVGDGLGADGLTYYVGDRFGTSSFTLDYADIPSVTLNASPGAPNLIGGAQADGLNGDNNANILVGREGNDVITANGGDDRLNGGSGADTMRGGTGNDTYLVDQAGDQVIEVGGEGTDTVITAMGSYTLPDNVENLQMNGAGAITGTGNALDNDISGTSANNILSGGGGADTLSGQTGDDTLSGGDGNDTLEGGSGDDTMFGDAGSDEMDGDIGHDTMNGGTGNDTMYGGNGSDTMGGGDDNDTMYGGALHDTMTGDAGQDSLFGQSGNDRLGGGTGDDILDGGADRDVFTGGAGADTFRFNQGDFAGMEGNTADRIDDFVRADGDVIDLAGVDAIATNGAVDDAFTFIGNAAFGNVAGQLRYEVSSGNTLISGDTDGDGAADFVIRVDGIVAFVAADFVL